MGVMAARFVPLVLALVGAALLACGGGDDSTEPTTTPAGAIATGTPGAESTPALQPGAASTVTPTPGPGPEGGLAYNGFHIFGEFEYAQAVDFPENVMMVIETGCTQCDGPTEALYRVWRNEGEAHVELLIDARISGAENASITGFALRPDLSDIVVAICTDCGSGGRPVAESPATLYRSRDGGTTWTGLADTAPGEAVVPRAITADGLVVESLGGNGLRYLDGRTIEAPAGANQLAFESRRVGALWWQADDGSRIVDAAGETIAIVEPNGTISSLAYEPNPGEWRAVTGWREANAPSSGWNVTRLLTDASLGGFHADEYVLPVALLDNGSVLGTVSLPGSLIGGTIGFIDVDRGVLTPIAGELLGPPFGNGQTGTGRNALQAALEGSFLRVKTGSTCVSIRADPRSQTAPVMCAADGVLVHDLGSTVTVGAQKWQKVRLLEGSEGYILEENVTRE
jgi:hypothetical protein